MHSVQPTTPPRALQSKVAVENATPLQRAVEAWQPRLRELFSNPTTEQNVLYPNPLVAYQCNDGFQLPVGCKEAEKSVNLLSEPYLSFNAELPAYGNFCFALSIGALRKNGIGKMQHGDEHWDNARLTLETTEFLARLYQEGVSGAYSGLLQPEDWPGLVDYSKLDNCLHPLVDETNAIFEWWHPNDVFDTVFLRLLFTRMLANWPHLFAILPMHDTYVTNVKNRKLISHVEAHLKADSNWDAVFKTSAAWHPVELTHVWKGALGEKARVYSTNPLVVKQHMHNLLARVAAHVPLINELNNVNEIEQFMKQMLPWWATQRLRLKFQEFQIAHLNKLTYSVFKRCCLAFTFRGELVYELDKMLIPGTPMAEAYWGHRSTFWDDGVRRALSPV